MTICHYVRCIDIAFNAAILGLVGAEPGAALKFIGNYRGRYDSYAL